MLRQPRIDAPSTLNYVMGRGIERMKIFRNKNDREDLIKRIEELMLTWVMDCLCLGPLIKPFSPFGENRRSTFIREYEEVCEREKEALRLGTNLPDLVLLARQVSKDEGITEEELKSGSRRTKISKARRLFCQLSVVKMGYPGAQVARLLGVCTSAVVRAANSEELPEVGNYL